MLPVAVAVAFLFLPSVYHFGDKQISNLMRLSCPAPSELLALSIE